jgi:hypothetical protein
MDKVCFKRQLKYNNYIDTVLTNGVCLWCFAYSGKMFNYKSNDKGLLGNLSIGHNCFLVMREHGNIKIRILQYFF